MPSSTRKALNVNEVCEINVFAVEALMAAYNESESWLEDLKVYLYENYQYLTAFFKEHLPGFNILPLQATYLVWVDCSHLGISCGEVAQTLLSEGKVRINEGTIYGDAGEGFIRINIATQRQRLKDGLERIKAVYG